MKGRFVERIGDLTHKKSSPAETNKVLKAQSLIEEQILYKDSVEMDISVIEQASVRPKKSNGLNLKKFEVVKDSTNNKEKKDEPPAKRKYKRVLKGFAWTAAGSGAIAFIIVLLDVFTKIYLDGYVWYLMLVGLGSLLYLSLGILLILLLIYAFLKQTKNFRGDTERKKNYTKLKWEYPYMLLWQLAFLPVAIFPPFGFIPTIFFGILSFIYFNKERKITKEEDFFNSKRVKLFVVFSAIICMAAIVLCFGF